MRKNLWCSFFIIPFICTGSHAGGLTLGGTRLIYDGTKKEASISLKNDEKSVPQLVQAWISDKNNATTDIPFITIPPVSKLSANGTLSIRVVFVGDSSSLLSDRESQWLFNVRAVPATEKKDDSQRLTVATQNIIKLIYRPEGLTPEGASEAGGKLNASVGNGVIRFDNPTPYVVTLTDMSINDKKVTRPGTIQPYGKLNIPMPVSSRSGQISYRTVNDFGGTTQKFQVNF